MKREKARLGKRERMEDRKKEGRMALIKHRRESSVFSISSIHITLRQFHLDRISINPSHLLLRPLIGPSANFPIPSPNFHCLSLTENEIQISFPLRHHLSPLSNSRPFNDQNCLFQPPPFSVSILVDAGNLLKKSGADRSPRLSFLFFIRH